MTALEHSVTLSRDRIQEVVDDAVKRGRMTHGDAEKMIGELLKRGRKQTDALVAELEKLVRQARRKLTRWSPRTQTDAAPRTRAPRKGERLEVEIDSLAFGRPRRRAAPRASSSSSRAGCPAIRVLAEVTKGKKRFAEAAHGRAAARRRRPPRRTAASTAASPARARPGRASPTSASWPRSRRRSRTRCAGSAGLDDFEMEPIVGAARSSGGYRNKLEYSFGDGRRRQRRRGRRARLPRRAAAGT